MKNPSSTQILSTGQTGRSCGCVSDPNTGEIPIALPNAPMPVQRTAEQPAPGLDAKNVGRGAFKANTGCDNP